MIPLRCDVSNRENLLAVSLKTAHFVEAVFKHAPRSSRPSNSNKASSTSS